MGNFPIINLIFTFYRKFGSPKKASLPDQYHGSAGVGGPAGQDIFVFHLPYIGSRRLRLTGKGSIPANAAIGGFKYPHPPPVINGKLNYLLGCGRRDAENVVLPIAVGGKSIWHFEGIVNKNGLFAGCLAAIISSHGQLVGGGTDRVGQRRHDVRVIQADCRRPPVDRDCPVDHWGQQDIAVGLYNKGIRVETHDGYWIHGHINAIA